MAILTTTNPLGSELENVLDDGFAMRLIFSPRTLSDDHHTMSFDSTEGGLSLVSTAGFVPGSGGIFNSVQSSDTLITGLSIDLQTLFSKLLDGDLAGANALFWGGADSLTGGAGNETLRGFGGNDTIFGGGSGDSLFGDAGQDRLNGELGDDYLSGGAGNDTLTGGAGNDTLLGGAGNDRLIGGAGVDKLIGGSGADVFVFATPGDGGAPPLQDLVLDFRIADGDRVDLSAIDANATAAGNQEFGFIGNAVFVENTPGTLRWTTQLLPSGVNLGIVQLNTDSDIQAEMVFTMIGVSSLLATDFFL